MSYVDIRLLFRSSVSTNDNEETALEYLGPGQIIPTNSESKLMMIVTTILVRFLSAIMQCRYTLSIKGKCTSKGTTCTHSRINTIP